MTHDTIPAPPPDSAPPTPAPVDLWGRIAAAVARAEREAKRRRVRATVLEEG